jgi:S1-C subfamily serine protease
MVMRILKSVTFILLTLQAFQIEAFLNQDSIEKIRNGVVSIKTLPKASPYFEVGDSLGTGFVVDRQKGIIVTNRHVVGPESPASHEVTFSNGQETTAKVKYADTWADFAFLEVDPKKIPLSVTELALDEGFQKRDIEVYIVGQNAGQQFSIHSGYISNLYESIYPLHHQCFRINFNARGGTSGSPVALNSGLIAGLVFSSDYATSAFAIPTPYLNDALRALKEGRTPKRYSMGAIVEYASLDRASRFVGFPHKLIEEYIKDYPQANTRGLRIKNIFKDSPLSSTLKPGDIVWAVNGQKVGPSLYHFEKYLNESQGQAKIDIYRGSQKITLEAKLENLQDHKIKKMVQFGGGIFFETDDYMRVLTGVRKGSVMLCNIQPGGSFSSKFPSFPDGKRIFINIKQMGEHEISTLEDVLKAIPQLIQKRDFEVQYKNYGVSQGYDRDYFMDHQPLLTQVTYSGIDEPPLSYIYDETKNEWMMKPLNLIQK